MKGLSIPTGEGGLPKGVSVVRGPAGGAANGSDPQPGKWMKFFEGKWDQP